MYNKQALTSRQRIPLSNENCNKLYPFSFNTDLRLEAAKVPTECLSGKSFTCKL